MTDIHYFLGAMGVLFALQVGAYVSVRRGMIIPAICFMVLFWFGAMGTAWQALIYAGLL
jgi:hypothetical protein